VVNAGQHIRPITAANIKTQEIVRAFVEAVPKKCKSFKMTVRTVTQSLEALGVLLASALLVHVLSIVFDVGVPKGDFHTHYRWAVQFAEALRDGDPYPHWMWRGNLGLGEVALLYYSPLFYYACGAIRLLTPNTWLAIRIVFMVSTIFAGFFGWRLFRQFMAEVYAVAGAVLLQWAPMVFMVFYYFNGFAWAVGFAALVALAYCVVRPGAFEWWVDLPASLAIAALVLTHIISALMALICFSFMCLCFVRRAQTDRRAELRVVSWFVSAGLGLALSAFYLVPAVAEMPLISPEVWTTAATPWSAFAFPTITTLAFGMRWFSFQWLVPMLTLLSVAAATWHASGRKDLSDSLGVALLRMLVVSWASLFLASELSYPLWLLHTPLRMVQFPHRFVYVTSVTGVVANILAVWDLRRTGQPWLRKLVVVLPLGLSFAATGVLSAKILLIDGKPYHLSVDTTTPYMGLEEYRLASQGEHWADYARAGGLAAECAEKVMICQTVETNSWLQAWNVSSSQPARLRLPLLAFPAWQVTIDGTVAAYTVDAATGLISVDLPAGTHLVAASWQRLSAERFGIVISGLALLVLMILAVKRGLCFPTRFAARSA
jgi:hypothetical protein